MADITWPALLPQKPQRGGYTSVDQDNIIKSGMDTGRPKTRRRFTVVSELINCIYWMTDAQREILNTFYRETSKNGSLLFDWPHPQGLVTVEAKFTSPPKKSYNRRVNVVSVQLEILP